ncbi:MAG: hypothetical protein UGF45_11705, partial [Massilioclostridium sp.]|nr:hypothetical protein [Massilioclostridium sp.]
YKVKTVVYRPPEEWMRVEDTHEAKAILEQRAKLLDMSGTQTSTQDSAALHCREDIARLKELSNLRTLDRQTVEKLIQSIRVYDGKRIEIVWNFSDSYMKLLTREEQNHEE